MSWDTYYTIRQNHKSSYTIETLFFGTKKVYDFKKVFMPEGEPSYFDTYEDCLKYIYDHNLINVHIRKTISNGGGVSHIDYKTGFNMVYKGYDFRKENDKPYNRIYD